MNKTGFLIVVAGFFMGFNSCKKDKQDENQIQKSYFTIENATYVNQGFPSASPGAAPTITDVYGNGSVLEGGSNPISFTTSATVKEVLVGVQGKNGYYKVNASELKSTSQTYRIYLLLSSTFAENTFTIIISMVDNAGLISESEAIHVSRITAGTGKLQVSCSWDQPNDLDLHLTEPGLTEIYWDNRESSNGGQLDVDSNPICYLDHINNENITYSGDAVVEKGTYKVNIALFEACTVTNLTHYVVTARIDGVLVIPTAGTNPYYGSVTAAEAYADGSGPREGKTVMQFNVSQTKSAQVNQRMLKFTYAHKPNLLKRSMETN